MKFIETPSTIKGKTKRISNNGTKVLIPFSCQEDMWRISDGILKDMESGTTTVKKANQCIGRWLK